MPRLDFAYAGIKFKSSYFNMALKGDYKNMINNERLSGILLHPTSLPSPYGIGDLGDEAYAFIDFLARAGQHLWQVLPLTHTGFGDSPYQSFSAFAGQPLLIDPRHLIRLGLIGGWELTDCPIADPSHVDYGQVIPWKEKVLALAYSRFPQKRHEIPGMDQSFQEFCESNRYWLDDYALFMACKKLHHGADWLHWPDEYRCPTLEFKAGLFKSMHEDIEYYRFIQFLFFDEWKRIKKYANDHGIRIIGDIPIFVSMDSADVWANKHLFQLDSTGYPLAVAGVPPDYFSATGQLWGNPLYNWDVHKAEGFSWWIKRIQNQLRILDTLRIDHFRGFEAYWSVPYGEETAINGHWVKAPGLELFTAVKEALGEDLPIIAEDLGVITDEVTALREHFHFPGMKVLQFAFDSTGEGDFLPHRFQSPNCICYTGTHDNDTTRGWFSSLREDCRNKVLAYTCTQDSEQLSHGLIRSCMASIAAYSIFPLQDVLDLGSDARMNFPGKASGNWNWRFKKDALTEDLAKELKDLSILYGRYYI